MGRATNGEKKMERNSGKITQKSSRNSGKRQKIRKKLKNEFDMDDKYCILEEKQLTLLNFKGN